MQLPDSILETLDEQVAECTRLMAEMRKDQSEWMQGHAQHLVDLRLQAVGSFDGLLIATEPD